MSEQNRRAYDQIADDYHTKRCNPMRNAWNEHIEVPVMERWLKHSVRNKRVLDLGCGTGILSERLSAWGADVFGIDQSPKMIEKAESLHPDLCFQTGCAEKLPFADSAFDIIASSLVMHYVQDLTVPFREVARVLKPGGVFAFTMHHPFDECLERVKCPDGGAEKVAAHPYFHNHSYTWSLCGVELVNYHHTLEDIFQGLKATKFVLLDIVECRPDTKLAGKFDGYDFASRFPTFIGFQVQKTP
ncbi:MAG: class I SAM-dependent methyltransferase [Bdellovibrionales bacterium]|nr:class I SAM-dependent methyltransferase [Bdellovibrionales bacterium]